MTGRTETIVGMAYLLAASAFWEAGVRSEPPPQWLAGPALQRQLLEPIGLTLSGSPLRQALDGLGRRQRVAVLLDRRIDPGQPVELRLDDVPLEDAFRQIAARHHLGYSLLGPVAYFGPPEVATRLPALFALRRDEARRLPTAALWLRLKPLGWRDFALPRELLAGLAEENGLRLTGLEQVPHDLWAAADLPPLALVDRLGLIAAQFDLTPAFSPAGDGLSLVRIPADMRLPPSTPEVRRPQAVSPGGKASKRRPEERYTVPRAKGPLEVLLRQLADRFGLELKIDREGLSRAGISLQQPVEFSVREATLDELLEAVLRPAGCAFRRRGDVLEVGPAR